eukprot:CAMPEP_0194098648 /NCGR_PEP_ID=MMETSP0149-20130528/58489_1 /TAXON_ID=122233 /ORGANISM="Chaetoceros debilis, Strain MM31A-1" /LENGTH=817 /DNA_ID=CAMNT_0038784705 /DNA_START=113 /DNA_END=2563 /DNA_ORIENTATION=+
MATGEGIKAFCNELRNIANALYFEQCNTDLFREQLRDHFQKALQLSLLECHSRSTHVIEYSRKTLQYALFYHSEKTFGNRQTSPKEQRKKLNTRKQYSSDGIDWEGLCISHDKDNLRFIESYHGDAASMAMAKSKSTALDIVIDTLTDISIIPACCTKVIIQGLLSVCVEVFSRKSAYNHATNKQPSSMKTIKVAILYLLQTRPNVLVTNMIKNYVTEQVTADMTLNSTMEEQGPQVNMTQFIQEVILSYDIERTLMIFSIINDLTSMEEIRGRRGRRVKIRYRLSKEIVIHPAISLLKEIDAIDTYFLGQTRKRKKDIMGLSPDDLCPKCRTQIFGDRDHKANGRKRIKTSNLAALHGETSDDEDPSSSRPFCLKSSQKFGRISWRPDQVSLLPLKRIMNVPLEMPSRVSCHICAGKERMPDYKSSEITALPIAMVELRAFLYRSVFDAASFWSTMALEGWSQIRNPLIPIIDLSLRHKYSASSRLCAVIVANHFGPQNGYMIYLKKLLKTINQCLNKNLMSKNQLDVITLCIQNYAEVINECAVFDNGECFWCGLKPLLDLILKSSDDKTGKVMYQDHSDFHQKFEGILLSHIGLMLMKRFSVLESAALSESRRLFNGYVFRLSEKFGDRAHVWLNDRMTLLEREQVILVLQKVGIITFFAGLETTDANASNGLGETLFASDRLCSLRGAYIRMGPKVECGSLLSDHTQTNILDDPRKRGGRERENYLLSTQIMDYLNDDIIREIFSCLGYKKLSHLTSVCKAWHLIGNQNSLWEQHYKRRFRPQLLEQLVPTSVCLPVRRAFILKHCERKELNW